MSPKTILVADDDADVRSAISSLLSMEGYEAIEMADGATALELLADAADGKRPRPDALLLDFCMPGMSGIGLLRVLQRFGSVPPTILMTALRDPSVEVFALKAGAVRVMRKPVQANDLLSAIRLALHEGGEPLREGQPASTARLPTRGER